MKLIQTLFLGFGTLLIISCADGTDLKKDSESATTEKSQSTTVKKTYKLKNYSKSCCTGLVEYALKEVNGFIKSSSNTKKQEITVWFNSKKCSESKIKKAINATGYTIVD